MQYSDENINELEVIETEAFWNEKNVKVLKELAGIGYSGSYW